MRQPVADLVRQGLSAVALDSPDLGGPGKKLPIFFPSNQAGKVAASFVFENNLLERNPSGEGCLPSLTETGWDWLRGQGVPVLNDFLRQVEQWKDQDRALIAKIRENSARLDRLEIALKTMLGGLGQAGASSPGKGSVLKTAIIEELSSNQAGDGRAGGASCDTRLPDLFQKITTKGHPKLTSGTFQDALRELHVEGKILLHPWTGTLYSIPEPEFAFLVGHEIAYYVSLKKH